MSQTLLPLPEEDEPLLPHYSTPGRILVNVRDMYPNEEVPKGYDRYEFDVLDYDGSAFWIHEGEGFGYWIRQHGIEFNHGDGNYLIEGIVGDYHRGDGWMTDDDVDWTWVAVEPTHRTNLADIEQDRMDEAEAVRKRVRCALIMTNVQSYFMYTLTILFMLGTLIGCFLFWWHRTH